MKLKDAMSARTQLFCLWCGPVGAVLFVIFFCGIAKFIPPPSPHWSTAHVVSFYASNRTNIRIGQVGGMIASIFLLPMFTVIAVQIARIERGRAPILALLEWGGGLILNVWFMICAMLWITATFRSDLSGNSVRMLNDFGWLSFDMVLPEYVLQMLVIGVAALQDKSADRVWPRWAGYFNCCIAFEAFVDCLPVFFKHGPFAWNGAICWWLTVCLFGVWLVVTTYLLHTGIRRQAAEAGRETGVQEAAPAAALARA